MIAAAVKWFLAQKMSSTLKGYLRRFKTKTMALDPKLHGRSGSMCELCNTRPATIAYTISPKDDNPENQVALCETCLAEIDHPQQPDHWRCLEGIIWNPEPSVQALSYRILYSLKEYDWASDVLYSLDLEDDVVQWAMSVYEQVPVHRDAFGNELNSGDTVVLTQNLDVKGTNFTAPKGTVVKKIRLVPDNIEQIEGKVNEQMIVILTKFVKKG